MPRAKRPLAERDPNEQVSAQPVSDGQKSKRQRTTVKTQFEQASFTGKYEYMCICKPPWAGDEEADDEDDDDGDDAGHQESDLVHMKPASEHPEWKWVMLRECFDLLDTAYKEADRRDPDAFGMYVYNDFFGYGLIEVMENMLKAFNKEIKSQTGKKANYQQMWAVVTVLANFLCRDVSFQWMMVDDCDRCHRLREMFGCLILTALNELDRGGQLTKNSKFLDLGHVMALFLSWSDRASGMGIEAPVSDGLFDDDNSELETCDWVEVLLAYAAKAEIDLAEQGVSGIDKILQRSTAVELRGNARVERWSWTAMLREYRKDYVVHRTFLALSSDNIGGDQFDLLSWTRQERAEHAFDKVDPLADFTDEQIAAGDLHL